MNFCSLKISRPFLLSPGFKVLSPVFPTQECCFISETKCNWTRGLVGMKWLGESKNMVLNGRRHGNKLTGEQTVSPSQTRSQHPQRASLRHSKSHTRNRRCSRSEFNMLAFTNAMILQLQHTLTLACLCFL